MRTPVQQLSIGVGAALLVLALFGAAAFASVSRLANEQEAVLHTNEAISMIDQLLVASTEAERAGTEFILTAAPDALNAFGTAQGNAEDALDGLRSAAEDKTRERAALDTLGPLIGHRFETLNAGITRAGAAAPQPPSRSPAPTRAARRAAGSFRSSSACARKNSSSSPRRPA